MPPVARRSQFGFDRDHNGTYQCLFEWPADCFVQCGGDGVVFGSEKRPGYRTAFFEAFPRSPDTYIRGEGVIIADAEAAAWAKYQRSLVCAGHEMEKRGYTNGAGFCRFCNLFVAAAFPPWESCETCGVICYRAHADRVLCSPCYNALPDSALSEGELLVRRAIRELEEL